jgi:hypothetical protein
MSLSPISDIWSVRGIGVAWSGNIEFRRKESLSRLFMLDAEALLFVDIQQSPKS